MIDAENSDLFDVLAYIAFALAPITAKNEWRPGGAAKFLPCYDGNSRHSWISYWRTSSQGVGELDQEKLGDRCSLKYHSVADAVDELGDVPVIRDTFVGFQRYLYEEQGASAPASS